MLKKGRGSWDDPRVRATRDLRRMGRERPGALLARGTRTVKRDGMTRVLVPCSRSAHDQNVLARGPQWDQHGCHSMRGEASWLGRIIDARSWDHPATPLK
jgi:hypothetical protein